MSSEQRHQRMYQASSAHPPIGIDAHSCPSYQRGRRGKDLQKGTYFVKWYLHRSAVLDRGPLGCSTTERGPGSNVWERHGVGHRLVLTNSRAHTDGPIESVARVAGEYVRQRYYGPSPPDQVVRHPLEQYEPRKLGVAETKSRRILRLVSPCQLRDLWYEHEGINNNSI